MRRHHLTRIAVAAATGRRKRLRELYRASLEDGIGAGDLQEATLQVLLFAGIPRTIDAFEELQSLVGTDPPLEPEAPADLEQRGWALFARIYGEHAESVRSRLAELHPDLARFVLRDAYGRLLARPFLAPRERELMGVAMLAALGLRSQLPGHVRGALRCGATPVEVRDAGAGADGRMRRLIEKTLGSAEP